MFGVCWPHKWEKWGEPYSVEIPERRVSKTHIIMTHYQKKQQRRCRRCGKIQEIVIETK